jgi:hypothetical protein
MARPKNNRFRCPRLERGWSIKKIQGRTSINSRVFSDRGPPRLTRSMRPGNLTGLFILRMLGLNFCAEGRRTSLGAIVVDSML